MNDSPANHERTYQVGDRLVLQEAAELFAARDKRPHEKKRQAVDRWRKRIRSAEQNGSLSSCSQTYEITELITWALQLKVKDAPNWPQRLVGLSRKPFLEIMSDIATVTDSAHDIALPGDLKRCHTEIRRLTNEACELRQALSRLHNEATVLRPKAKQYDRICEKNQASGRIRKKP